MLIFSYYLKGCVQGYGSYEELTSSGVDPRELFDDIEDVESPNLITTDVVIEDYNDVVEETDQNDISSSGGMHLLPADKTRKRSRYSEYDPGLTNQVLGESSMYTTPSMFSLISMPNKIESNTRIDMVSLVFSLNKII